MGVDVAGGAEVGELVRSAEAVGRAEVVAAVEVGEVMEDGRCHTSAWFPACRGPMSQGNPGNPTRVGASARSGLPLAVLP